MSHKGEGSGEKQLDPPAEHAQFPEIMVPVFSGGLSWRPRPEFIDFLSGQDTLLLQLSVSPKFVSLPPPFSSAELQPATAGTPGGTTRDEDSRSTATPRPCVR